MNGTWTQTAIAGKPADVFAPTEGIRPRFGLLFLHDLDEQTLIHQPVFTRLLDGFRLACVCPHGRRSWWVDRVCAEFDPNQPAEDYLVENVLPFFDERWKLRPPAIGLLGVGMGGQGALRLAFRHPQTFRATAGIAPAIEYQELYYTDSPLGEMYDSKEQARQDTAIMHIPRVDPPPHVFFAIDPGDAAWFRGNDRLHEKLAALGVEHTCDLTTEAGGHTWDYFNRMAEPALRFLVQGLEKESRRLI